MPEYTLLDGRHVRPATPAELAERERRVREVFSSRPKTGALALARRDWWITYLREDLGLISKGVDIPPPIVTDEEYALRTEGRFPNREAQSLIVQIPNAALAGSAKWFKPFSRSLAYDRFMAAVGQRDDPTVTNETERREIVWEPVPQVRWRWIETPDRCPRIETSWNDLTAQLAAETPPSQLPSLEECVLVWHATRNEHNRTLNVPRYSWLRTRCGPDTFSAYGSGGRVHVSRMSDVCLGFASDISGGRASDPVPEPA